MSAGPAAHPWRTAWLLVGLRWRMVRSRRTRAGLAFGLVVALAAMLLAVPIARQTPRHGDPGGAIALALVVFLTVAALAPLAAGGGYQLFPPDQLAPHPVPSSALVRISLLLTPLNLAWYAQTIGIVGLTIALRLPGGGTLAVAAFAASAVVASTVIGQAVSWWVAGVRRNRSGRRATWVLMLGLLVLGYLARNWLTTALVRRPGRLLDTLRPDGYVVLYLISLLLIAVTALALRAADHGCAWALGRRTVEAPVGQQNISRRPDPASPYRARLTMDRASVWRSPPLKRGVFVLALLPAASAAIARLDWPSLALLPGFVATGAALLFGVNAFCLEGGGAIWLLSQPQDARIALYSKAQVILETTLLAVAVAMSGGLLRARYAPDALGVAAVLASTLVAAAVVLATCLRLTIARPHRADLLGPRDTPAPPGSMAAYAVRLTVMAGFPAATFSIFARLELGWPILLLAAVMIGWAGVSILRTIRRWQDPAVRVRVAVTVAAG